MPSAVVFDNLVDEMQAAALGMASWDAALRSIARLFGANSVILHKELWHGGGWGVRIGGDDRAYSDYFGHYAGVHPLASRTVSTPAGSVLTDRMIMPRTEFERTEFYRDWARPNRYDEIVHVRLDNSEHALVGLSLTRPNSARGFDAADLQLARRMAPYLRRAVAIYEKFEEIRQANEGMMDALDRMRRGVFGLRVDGRVIFANETARTMLAAGDALRMDDGVLAAARPDQTRALRRMLQSVVRGEAPATLAIERSAGRPPLRLVPVRLRPTAGMVDLRPPPPLLLLVHDPAMNAGAVMASLRERYGLTATEAAVAFHAARGKGLAAVARALGIGQGTVRSHLKRVFAKTQTNRQAELAWIVSKCGEMS